LDSSTASASGAASAAPQAGGEQQLVAAHEAMLKTPGLQFDFASLPQPKPPPWLKALVQALEAIAPVLKYIFWGGLILGGALLIYFIGRELLGVRFGWKRKKKASEAPDWRPEPQKARALLEDADRLAAEGRFSEAVHLLLFRSIDDLSGRRPGAVRPALTSRDIAAMGAMPPAARTAFGQIARVVEAGFFGGRPVGREDFAACRTAYEGFAFAEGWA
jgi:uncharacterized protein DUF4129